MTLAALAGTAGAVVVLGYIFFGHKTPRPAPPTTLGQLTAPTGLGGGGGMSALDVRIDLMDRKDPNRQAGRLMMSEMNPLEGHHYEARKPQGFLYLTDGRTIHVKADKGNLYMPDRSKEPESGTLTGNVVIRAFEAKAGGAAIDPDQDTPIGTIRTDSLSFDNALGKADTPDRVTVESPDARLSGRGLRVIFNQVRQRLELLEIERGEELRYQRMGFKPRTGTPRPPTASTPPAPAATGGPVAPADPKPPVETLYSIVFNDTVTTTQERRVINADKLQAWVRLIDNRLPDGAIAPVRSAAGGRKTPPAEPTPAATGENPAVASIAPTSPEQPATPGASAGAGPLVLRWTGPCVITPIDDAPPELKQDHVALRYTAEQAGRVTFEDASRDAAGHGAYLEYGATTRRMVLAGPGPASAAMSMGARGAETRRIEGVRVDSVITADGTMVTMPGPSKLVLIPEGAPANARPYTIACVEKAVYTFAAENGAVTDRLVTAAFKGTVRAEDPTGMNLEGDSVTVEFEPGAGRPAQNEIRRVIVDGRAVAHSADNSRLAAEHVEVTFRTPDGKEEPEPTALSARGGFALDRGPTHLEGESLEATLARDSTGKTAVTHATARERVRFTDKTEGLAAECDLMVADLDPGASDPGAPRQVVDLSGARVVVKRGEGAEQSTITGTNMRLDAMAHRLDVLSAGEIDHRDAPKAGAAGLASLKARWSRGMTYDDGKGAIELVGDVVADASADALTRDHVEASRVVMSITPRKTGPTPVADLEQAAGGAGGRDTERKLLSAEAIGWSADEHGEARPARLESRRYAPDAALPDGQKLIELYYVEGPRVVADNIRGTVDVPAKGRLLLLDHKGGAPAPGAAQPGTNPADGRGSALFDWDGSMHMDRATGEVHMKQAVQLTHQRLDTREVTNLSAHEVTARFRQKPGGAAEPARGASGELISAVAVGSVHLSLGPARTPEQPRPPSRELAADRLTYDAVARTADATAQPGGTVRFFDPTGRSPMSASRIVWDLARDRVEIKDPGAVTAPR